MSADGGLGRVIAIIRLPSAEDAVRVGEIIAGAGLTAVEVTLTTPGALDAVTALRAALPASCLVGAGSVRTPQQALSARDAGAQFLVTPTLKLPVLAATALPVMCGAFSPTEIETASEAGAALVKVFPAGAMGPSYVRELLAPMPELKLAPTGGVTPDLVGAYAAAGAVAVGVGSALVSAALVASRDWPALHTRATAFATAAAAAWPDNSC
ncbi:2-dehydro-3-deoxyphosphogluconate aldolase/(4S)-4-hydroxy-2-oxoglutarate aldolase [Allocatelliglobosispora scoriae]|uniref:2-dehydro-3-deoxyphosphogluconate aldolase/(4S)-4-hydroxy-2-oxoglutarate aldolase n=1 Tax=Allocatelliglobosispora scoriae TaxID=643052 RepID=A0A841C3I4_9ACTN|nr:bifunctional 4-hydroxy-2-oxoglutarate aldolase/2-dehydro-3-deoxy-phosphogluconate aldolase [Allocatelliglobosispora scoriae]MBB5874476.1 2-dehydro-3-deoxyphosphogluconate aldolase/(4S)-4-hydroxy-2-oxoglutarate aldolase [Allocatelliglobosispora scoriae]